MGKGQRNIPKSELQESELPKVAKLYLSGMSLRQISKKTGLSRPMTKKSVDKIRKIWRRRASQTYQQHVDENLARIDQTENAAWLGWERSLLDDVVMKTKDGYQGDSEVNTNEITRRKQSGNPAFLDIVSKCVKQRCELLGLLDPDVREELGEDVAEVMTLVVASREEAAEYKELSMNEFRSVIETSEELEAEGISSPGK